MANLISIKSAGIVSAFMSQYLDNLWSNPYQTLQVMVIFNKETGAWEFYKSKDKPVQAHDILYTTDMFLADLDNYSQYEMDERIQEVVNAALSTY